MKYLFLGDLFFDIMKYILFSLFIVAFSLPALSQITRPDYISRYQLLAIEEMNRSGIPASIKMAQACLESANGNSELSKKSNNHFGIKCKSSWKGKKVYYDDDRKNECFRKYRTVEESYIDHTDFLLGNPRYASLFSLKTDDYKGWAKGLKKAGYATANDYAKNLIKIIEDYQLYRLDYKITFEELAVYEQTKIGNDGFSNSLTINPYLTREIITVNGLKSVVARKGDTFEIIAQETGKKNWEIYRFNDVQKGYKPQANEIVYIQQKKRRAPKTITTHAVQSGETLHFISQMYGVKLKPLFMRNGIKFGEQPEIGQIISLRKKNKQS